MTLILSQFSEVTPDWLTAALQESGVLTEGRVESVKQISYEKLKCSISAKLALGYSKTAASGPQSVFLKMALPNGNSDTTRFGEKEIRFYTEIGPRTRDLPLLQLYHSSFCPVSGHWHMLLQDVSQTHWTSGSLPPVRHMCARAMEVLACLHAYWWDHPSLGEIASLPDENTATALISHTESYRDVFLDFIGDRISSDWHWMCQRIFREAPRVLSRRILSGRNLTLIHGDNHHLNHMYPHDRAHGSVYIIDWPAYRCWIGLDDLAYMMALNWMPECRRSMEYSLVRHYYDSLTSYGVKNYSWQDCWNDYRLSVIQMFFIPIHQWVKELPPWLWYNNFECVTAAFRDLECADLLA